MSHNGKMLRGAKWYEHRDREGKLPIEISGDPGKMCDVNYFLENNSKVETDIDWSSKSKKELEATIDTLNLDRKEAKTKDDLIVILENNSDAPVVDLGE